MKKIFNIIVTKIKGLFKQGLTPHQLALSIVLALVISLFPIIGLTTVVVSFVAISLKLNFPIMITLAYTMEPIKLFLIVPFIKLGAKIFNVQHELLSYLAIKNSFDKSIWITIKDLAHELICGSMGWFVTTIPVGVLLYFSLKGIFSIYRNSRGKQKMEEHSYSQ